MPFWFSKRRERKGSLSLCVSVVTIFRRLTRPLSSHPAAVLKMMMMTETSLTIEILTSCFVFEIPNSHLIKREATGAARSSESTPEYGAA